MSFQITILKVLAGHPEGRASLADLKQYVAVLACSGADWSQRMRTLAARVPDLDIFSSGYVLRETSEWRITDKGRAFLILIEAPSVAQMATATTEVPLSAELSLSDLPPNVIQMFGHKVQRRRRRAAA